MTVAPVLGFLLALIGAACEARPRTVQDNPTPAVPSKILIHGPVTGARPADDGFGIGDISENACANLRGVARFDLGIETPVWVTLPRTREHQSLAVQAALLSGQTKEMRFTGCVREPRKGCLRDVYSCEGVEPKPAIQAAGSPQ